MSNEALKEKITTMLPQAAFEENRQYLAVNVTPDLLYTFMKELKDFDETAFDYLFCFTGVDYGDALGVVYHLESTRHGHALMVKVRVTDRENPEIDSVTDIWAAAELQENEVFDLFGIRFRNHPDLRRLFLFDEWKGFPMRKDYVDEINIIDLE